jgi:hypothetical protein
MISALAAFSAAAVAATPPALPLGSALRVTSSSLADGWNPGTLVRESGCLSVSLKQATNSGTTLVSLGQVTRLQRQEGDQWVDYELARVLAAEPNTCREVAREAKDKSEKTPAH